MKLKLWFRKIKLYLWKIFIYTLYYKNNNIMSDFKTLLIQDSRIANITDKETFAVFDGASQST